GASMSAILAPQPLERRALRLNARLGVRRLRFLSRRGLDSVAGVQDVPVGWEAMLTVGRSMGGTERGGPDDTFGRVGFLAGWSSDRLAGQVRVGVEGRRDDAAPSGFRH